MDFLCIFPLCHRPYAISLYSTYLSLRQHLDWTCIGHHNTHFSITKDPYEDNLERKSILFAWLLKLKFGTPGQLTTKNMFMD